MKFENIEGVLTFQLGMVETTLLAGLLLMLGYFLRRKFNFLEKFCIPAPVIGGLIFALIAWSLKSFDVLAFSLDTSLQTPFMIAFFACVGFSGSFALLKRGGKALIIFLVICWAMAFIQNVVGVSLAKVLNINPLLGVMAGAVSLTGGHGNAAAFGPLAEGLGATGAEAVAVAAATYGLIAGSLSGGPFGRYLIEKFKPQIKTSGDQLFKQENVEIAAEKKSIDSFALMKYMTFVGVFMVIGTLAVDWVAQLNIKNFALPAYVGAMFAAIIFRNINDKFAVMDFREDLIDLIRDVGLGFFLTMAIMGLKIWELASLALPLIIILLVQTVIVFIVMRFVVWPAMGKDYDAGVITAGFSGVGLGVTATGIASMSVVTEHYHQDSPKALIIVPLCNAVFIDIVAIPAIIWFLQMFA